MRESFASAMERARQSFSYWDRKKLDKKLEHLQAAHDAEMKQLSKTEYHRGYEDGKAARKADEWQLDRERVEVVRGLLALEFDGGSHHNLSRIAHAVYSPQTSGWTAGACEQVRDELVRLLGGNGDASDLGPDSVDAAVADSGQVHAPLMTYDVLGNERHKAVCELRKMPDWYPSTAAHSAHMQLAENFCRAIGVEGIQSFAKARDRLIYLLGGNQPTLSDLYGIWKDTDQSHDSVSMGQENETKDTVEPVSQEKKASPNIWYDTMEHDFWITGHDKAPTDHSVNLQDAIDSIIRKTGSVEDPKTPESVENLQETVKRGEDVVPISSITDELRDYVYKQLFDSVHCCKLLAIADRINEQFARCCEMWERTATDTAQEVHDSMEAERNKLVDERDMWHGKVTQLAEVVDRYVGQYEDVLELLKDAARDYQDVAGELAEADVAIENWRERGRSFAESERMRMELIEEVNGLKRAAERDADVIESMSSADECMKLPTDMNIEPIAIGDAVKINGRKYKVMAVSQKYVWINAFDDDQYRLVGYPSKLCKLVADGE